MTLTTSLPTRVRPVLAALQQTLAERLGQAPRLILFGSYARGQATPWSDVDVCAVLPRWDADTLEAALDVAWEVGFEHGLIISLIPMTEDEWETAWLPLAQTLRREGIVL